MIIRKAVAWAVLGSVGGVLVAVCLWLLCVAWIIVVTNPIVLLEALLIVAAVLAGIAGLSRLFLWALGQLV